jgi:hypothetical protein
MVQRDALPKGSEPFSPRPSCSQPKAHLNTGPKRHQVGDSGVMALAAKCSGLLSLYAVRTPITDAALLALGKGCGGLRELHVAACLGLSDDGLLVTTQPLKLGD